MQFRSNPLCHDRYFYDNDGYGVQNGLAKSYTENDLQYRKSNSIQTKIESPSLYTHEEEGDIENSPIDSYYLSTTTNNVQSSYDFECEQENNNIEETEELPFEYEKYDGIHSMEESPNSSRRQDVINSNLSRNIMKVTEPNPIARYNNVLSKKPIFPSSAWNQSITLEDKVQRFLAQAAELAHQNTKVTSKYPVTEPENRWLKYERN